MEKDKYQFKSFTSNINILVLEGVKFEDEINKYFRNDSFKKTAGYNETQSC